MRKRRNVETAKSRNGHPQNGEDFDLVDSTFGLSDVSAPAPDMTRRIMGRLGYMQISQGASRRRRLRLWGQRSGIVLAAALALGVGVRVFESSSDIRRPEGPTIPAAIGNDLQRHQQHLGDVIKRIRTLAAPRFESVDLDQPQSQDSDPWDGSDDDPGEASFEPFGWA